MTGNEAFVGWVKKAHPQVYAAAVQMVKRKSAFGGLGDDLISDISFDPNSISVSDFNVAPDSGNPQGAPTSSGNSWSSVIDSIANAIPKVAGSIVQTKSALDTINVNARLAQQNKPLLPYGSLLTGAGGVNLNVLLWGGAFVGALLLLRGRSRAR